MRTASKSKRYKRSPFFNRHSCLRENDGLTEIKALFIKDAFIAGAFIKTIIIEAIC